MSAQETTAADQEGRESGKGKRHLNHFESVVEIRRKYAEQIEELRRLIPEPLSEPDDIVVYRFLRGHKFSVPKASKYLNNSLKWRAEFGTKAIRKRVVEKEMKQMDFPHAKKFLSAYPHDICHNVDRLQQPMSIDRVGHVVPGFLLKVLTFEQLLQYHIHHLEFKAALASKLTKESGKVFRMSKIMDLKGLSAKILNRKGLSWIRKLIHISQDNYPEMLGNLYIINAPWVFRALWKIIRPWLEPATLEKIQMLGSNYREKLRELVDDEVLPDFLGGQCDKCVGGCCALVDTNLGMTEHKILAGACFEHKMQVEANTWVSWEFRTKSRDVGFSVSFQPASKDVEAMKEIFASSRVKSYQRIVDGSFRCEQPGTLTFRWDNSFSMWHSKYLLYRVDSEKCLEEEEELKEQM